MKKRVVSIFVLVILLAGNVNAGALATIGMQGLSFVSPETGQIVNGIVCVSNPILCVQGKIIGAIQGELLNTLAKVSPEAVRVISMYNQVKLYTDAGAEITEELQVNDQGVIEKGTMEFGQNQESINEFIGKDIENKVISVSNVQIAKEEGISTITTKEKGFLVITKTNPESGEERSFSYDNIKEGGKLELDEKGELIGADFTTNEQGGTYVFGSDQIAVPPNSKVLFKDGVVNVRVPERSSVKEFPTQVEGFGGNGNIITYSVPEGSSTSFPGGIQLNGGSRLSFKNGRAFIPRGRANINEESFPNELEEYAYGEVNINQAVLRSAVDTDVNVFFDGKDHPESNLPYVSMDPRKGIILADYTKGIPAVEQGYEFSGEIYKYYPEQFKKQFSIEFKENNPFAKVEKNDFFKVTVGPQTRFELENREDMGLIPELRTNIAENGILIMENGALGYSVDANSFSRITGGGHFAYRLKQSTPMSVRLLGSRFQTEEQVQLKAVQDNIDLGKLRAWVNAPADKRGQVIDIGLKETRQIDFLTAKELAKQYSLSDQVDLLGTPYEPKKLVITNFNELGTIDAAVTGDVTEIRGELQPVVTRALLSERLSYNYDPATACPHCLLPGINIELVGFEDGLGPNQLSTIHKSEIKLFADYSSDWTPQMKAAVKKVKIYEEEEWIRNWQRTAGSGAEPPGGYVNRADPSTFHIGQSMLYKDPQPIYHEAIHSVDMQMSGFFGSSPLRNEWNSVVSYGDISYQQYFSDGEEWGRIANKVARYGFSKPHGHANIREDMAEIATLAQYRPGFYAELVDPNSDFYSEFRWQELTRTEIIETPLSEQEKQVWADQYSRKLFLTRKYGLLSPQKYNEVIGEK